MFHVLQRVAAYCSVLQCKLITQLRLPNKRNAPLHVMWRLFLHSHSKSQGSFWKRAVKHKALSANLAYPMRLHRFNRGRDGKERGCVCVCVCERVRVRERICTTERLREFVHGREGVRAHVCERRRHKSARMQEWDSTRVRETRCALVREKWTVSFHTRATSYKALLRKMTYKDDFSVHNASARVRETRCAFVMGTS